MIININIFLVTLLAGFILVYIFHPKPNIVIKYPTPENINKIIYKDDAGLSYKYTIEEVK